MTIQLGDKARDSITGFEGIAVARTAWLYGCVRLTLQPEKIGKDGKMLESATFDEPQLILVKSVKPALSLATGGPRPEPTRSKDPK